MNEHPGPMPLLASSPAARGIGARLSPRFFSTTVELAAGRVSVPDIRTEAAS
jgi:hypothetical protein